MPLSDDFSGFGSGSVAAGDVALVGVSGGEGEKRGSTRERRDDNGVSALSAAGLLGVVVGLDDPSTCERCSQRQAGGGDDSHSSRSPR